MIFEALSPVFKGAARKFHVEIFDCCVIHKTCDHQGRRNRGAIVPSLVVVMFGLLGKANNTAIKLYPRILGYGIGIVTTAIGVHHYMKIQTKALEVSMYENMEKGSKLPLPKKQLIPREGIAEEVKRFFFPDYKVGDRETAGQYANGFGIIVGPTGSGKTTLVVDLCNKFPQGVLYYHAMEPEVFSQELAETVAMKIHPLSV